MAELQAKEVAEWLMNEDCSGATDEEFLKTFKLMEEKLENQLRDDYTFLDWLKDVLDEIENKED